MSHEIPSLNELYFYWQFLKFYSFFVDSELTLNTHFSFVTRLQDNMFYQDVQYLECMCNCVLYFIENVKVPKKKTEDFKSLVRNFDKTVMVSETKCR